MEGTIKFFNTEKGFGFIAGEDGKEYFVHVTDLVDSETLPRDNDAVTFDVVQGDRGPKAGNVAMGGAAPAEAPAEEAAEEPAEEAPAEEPAEDAPAEEAPAEDAAEEAPAEEAAEEPAEEPADGEEKTE